MGNQAAELANNRSFDQILTLVLEIGKSTIAEHVDEVDATARFPTEAFDALKDARLLSTYVPKKFGGDELTITEVCRICEAMALYDASTAMIYAMHQIQVACIVHHASEDEYFGSYLRDLCENQLLLASATTEIE